MKLALLALTAFGLNAFAQTAQLKVSNAPGWSVEQVTKSSRVYAITAAEAILTAPGAGGSQPVFVQKLPSIGVPKTVQQWSQVVLAGRPGRILNQTLKAQKGKPRYVVEYEYPFSKEIMMRSLVLATVINGEIYAVSYSMNPDEFKTFAPNVTRLFRTIELSVE